MRAHVTLEQPRSTEFLTAVPTFTALCVRPHVHTVGGHGDVHLFAMWTLPRFLVCSCPVGLSVPGKIAARAVTLTALHADVSVQLAGNTARWRGKQTSGDWSIDDVTSTDGVYWRVKMTNGINTGKV